MVLTPLVFEVLNFTVVKFVRLESSPGRNPARVPKCQVAGFADAAFRTILCEGPRRDTVDQTCGRAIWFVAWISSGIVAGAAVFHFSSATKGEASIRLSIDEKSPPNSRCPGAA